MSTEADIVETLKEAWVADALEAGHIRSTIVAERMIRERHAALDEITKLRAERDAAVAPPVVWGGTYADLMAEFDSAEGYPADDWIEKFERMPPTAITFDQAIDFLLNQLPMIEKHISCMSVVQTVTDDGATEIAFHTGGWSGAESLIACMERQFWINYFLKRWVRGGHFYYEVVKPKAPAVIATSGKDAT